MFREKKNIFLIKKIGYVFILFILLFSFFTLFFAEKNIDENGKQISVPEINEKHIKKDNFQEIKTLKLKQDPIQIYGKTSSDSEVDVFIEVPARVKTIAVQLGDRVFAGQIMMRLNDTNERDLLRQAQSSYAIAQAQLNRTLAGNRIEHIENAKNDFRIKETALEKTRKDIIKNIEATNIFLDATLRNDIDDYFAHTETNPVFNHRIKSETQMNLLEADRKKLGENWKKYKKVDESVSVEIRLNEALKITNLFVDFSDSLYQASQEFLGLSDSEREQREAVVLGIKNSVNVKNSELRSLKNLLDTQRYLLNIAENNHKKLKTGATVEDINISKSNLSLSQARIKSAQTALSKKIITAPISGIISAVNVNKGELVNSGISVFSISNPQNLKVEINIPVEHLKHIYIGKKVKINNQFLGVVSKIAPTLNQKTGLLKIEINFTEKNINILAGDIVNIQISRENLDDSFLLIPISAIFEENREYFVYILDENFQAKKEKVEFIKISGNYILIRNIFNDEQNIIINVRGVVAGQQF